MNYWSQYMVCKSSTKETDLDESGRQSEKSDLLYTGTVSRTRPGPSPLWMICLKDWLQGHKLSSNVLKTHAMVVGSHSKLKRISDEVSGQPSFFINGTQIETIERTKYLGVKLDCHLVWDEHIKCMRTKVSRALGFLKYAKKFLPQDTLSKMYRGIVEPHFRYCCSVWGCCCKTRIDNIQNCKTELSEMLLITAFVFQQLI